MTALLIDMDGVIADFTGGLADAIGPSEHFHPERQTNWSLKTGDPDTDRATRAAMREPGFFRSLKPIPGAVEHVSTLLAHTEVRFCSTPLMENPTGMQDKYDWLLEHFGAVAAHRLILTQDKTLVHGSLLVDDKPVITGIAEPSWRQVVFDQPYNREAVAPRITGWDDTSTDFILNLINPER